MLPISAARRKSQIVILLFMVTSTFCARAQRSLQVMGTSDFLQQAVAGSSDTIDVASQEAVLSVGTANYQSALNHLNHTLANHFLLGPTQACWAIARYSNAFPNLRTQAEMVLADAGIPYTLAEGNPPGSVGCKPGKASGSLNGARTI